MGERENVFERLRERLSELRREAEAELAESRERLRYRVERGRVVFDAEARDAHRAAREGWARFLSRTRPLVVLTAPVIYALVVPLALLDLAVTIYQRVCFPVYGIARVRRRDHVYLDRHQLGYLNGLQKLNCVYCGYANGVISYVREVAARTELYWCPIKHSRLPPDPHHHYASFVAFGDPEAFQERVELLRKKLANDGG